MIRSAEIGEIRLIRVEFPRRSTNRQSSQRWVLSLRAKRGAYGFPRRNALYPLSRRGGAS
jgi:hypothetical protein